MKKLIILFFIVFFSFSLVACDTIGGWFGNTNDSNTYDKNDNGIPDALDVVIGYGYDITGSYANPTEIKATPILDLENLVADGNIEVDPNTKKSVFETISGSTIINYQENLGANVVVSGSGGVRGIGYFSAEVGASFDMEKAGSDMYSFATTAGQIWKEAYRIKDRETAAKHIPYLTESFKTDVESLTPEQLVNKYGTHVMLGGVLGARLSHHMTATKKAGSSNYNLSAYANAEAKGTFSSTSIDTSIQQGFNNSFETGSAYTKTVLYGGDVEWGIQIHTKNEYDNWIASIKSNEIWSDYYPNSLMDISDLIEEYAGQGWEAKKDALQTYIATYTEGKKIDVTHTVDVGTYDSGATFFSVYKNNGGKTSYEGADAEIDSESGKVTGWHVWYSTTVAADGESVNVDIMIGSFENGVHAGGNNSIVKVIKSFNIYIGRKLKSCSYDNGYGYYSNSITGSLRGEITVENNGPFYDLRVTLDDDGKDDRNCVGSTTKLNFTYEYYPYG